MSRTAQKNTSSNGTGPLALARVAYDAANYDRCRELLDLVPARSGAVTAAVALLRARSSYVQCDYVAAHAAALEATRAQSDAGDRLLSTVVYGASASKLGRTAEARRTFASLDAEFGGVPVRDTAEARAWYATELFDRGEDARARRMLEENVKAHAFEAGSLILLGCSEAKRGRYREAREPLAAGERKLSSESSDGVRLGALAVASLAAVAAQTVDLELARRVRALAGKRTWPDGVNDVRYVLTDAASTLALLDGDIASAYFEARAAASLAPLSPEIANSSVRAAAIARILGDRGVHRIELRHAWDVLRAASPPAIDAVFAAALAKFAAEAAATMTQEARKALALARAALPHLASSAPPSLEAFVDRAAARIAGVAGRRADAIHFGRKAFDAWHALGTDLSIALVAIDLHRNSGDDAYLKIARRVAARAPKAWFAAELRGAKSPVRQLTRAERVVLARILRGESAKAIGSALDRSPFTISNHTRKIFAAFNLNSRTKVIARCVELGITSESVERT